MIGIIITCFNRPDLLSRTLESLKQSDLTNTMICLVDDASNDPSTKQLIKDFQVDYLPIIKIYKPVNSGVWDSLKKGINCLLANKCDMIMILDADTLVKPDFVSKMSNLHHMFDNECEYHITAGFNKGDDAMHLLVDHSSEGFNEKINTGGVSMMFNEHTFRNIIEPSLIDRLWDITTGKIAKEKGCRYFVTIPSVVQHIGHYGMNSGNGMYDFATDF